MAMCILGIVDFEIEIVEVFIGIVGLEVNGLFFGVDYSFSLVIVYGGSIVMFIFNVYGVGLIIGMFSFFVIVIDEYSIVIELIFIFLVVDVFQVVAIFYFVLEVVGVLFVLEFLWLFIVNVIGYDL